MKKSGKAGVKSVASKIVASKKVTVQSLLKKRMTRSSLKQRKQAKGKYEALDKRKTRAALRSDQTKDNDEESVKSDEKVEKADEKIEKVDEKENNTKEIRASRNVKNVQSKASNRTESPVTRSSKNDLSTDSSIPEKTKNAASKHSDSQEKTETQSKPKESTKKISDASEIKGVESDSKDERKNRLNTKQEKKTNDKDTTNCKDEKITRTTRSITKANDESSQDSSQDSVKKNEQEVKPVRRESKVVNKNGQEKNKDVKECKQEETKVETFTKNLEAKNLKAKNDEEDKPDSPKKVLKKAGTKPKINFDEIVRDETFVSKNRAAKSNDERKVKPESQGKAKKKKDVAIEENSGTVFVTKVVVEKIVDVSPVKGSEESAPSKLDVEEATTADNRKPPTATNAKSLKTANAKASTADNTKSSTTTASINTKVASNLSTLDKPVISVPEDMNPTVILNKVEDTAKVDISSEAPSLTSTPEKTTGNKTEAEAKKPVPCKIDLIESEDKNSSVSKTETNKNSPVVKSANLMVNLSKAKESPKPEEKADVKRCESDSRKNSTPCKVKRVQLTPSKLVNNANSNLAPKPAELEDKMLNTKDTSYTSSILNINAHSTLKPRSRATVFSKTDTVSSPMTQIADNFRLNFVKDFDKKDSKSPASLAKKEAISESTIAELDKELSNFVKDIVKSDWDGKSFEIPLSSKPVSRDTPGNKGKKLISTIDFINSTPVKCSSEEPVSIRNDKVIISPLRKLTENEIRILLAQESPMKEKTEVFTSSALENLSRTKDSDDSVSKLCIEKITNEIISLIDPKMNLAETQDIIKKYNLNKQLHSKLGDEISHTQRPELPLETSPVNVNAHKPPPDPVLDVKQIETPDKQTHLSHSKDKSLTTNQYSHKQPTVNNERLATSLLANPRLEQKQPSFTSLGNQTLIKPQTPLPLDKQPLLVRPRFDTKALFFNQSSKTPESQNLSTNQKSGYTDKLPTFTKQKPEKPSFLLNQNLKVPEKQHLPVQVSKAIDKQQFLSHQMTDKQQLAAQPIPKTPDKPGLLLQQNLRTPDKQQALVQQSMKTPDKQLSPAFQPLKTPEKTCSSPGQRSEKQSLLAHKKSGTLDKQYRLSSLETAPDKDLTSPKKPTLLPSQRSSAIDKQYRVHSPVEHQPLSNQRLPQPRPTDPVNPGQKFEPTRLSEGVSSQEISRNMAPEQVTSLNLSQKSWSTFSLDKERSKISDAKSNTSSIVNVLGSPKITDAKLKSATVASTKVLDTKSSLPVPSHSPVSKSSDTKTASPVPKTLDTKSIDTVVSKSVQSRPSTTAKQPPATEIFSEVPITLSNTYQTILDSRLSARQATSHSPLTRTEPTKPDLKSVYNVQKSDCDKTDSSQARKRSVEEDNKLIANYIKEKTEIKTGEEKAKSSDTKDADHSKKNPPERQVIKAFEDKNEPKSSPTKNIRKYSNLGKKSTVNQCSKHDRNFTKSLRTKRDTTNYLEDFSSTDTSGDDLVSKTSSISTAKKVKRKVANPKEKATKSESASEDSDVEDLIEKIRKDERKKSKVNAKETDSQKSDVSKENMSTRSAKLDSKKPNSEPAPLINDKNKGKTKLPDMREVKEDQSSGSRRLRSKQSVLYNLESLETDSETTEDELVSVRRKSEDQGKKRKSKNSSSSEHEESDSKTSKSNSKKMKTETKESDHAKPKRGRKKKVKETDDESEIGKESSKKTDRGEDESKETSESDSEVKKKKTLKKRGRKPNASKHVEESSDSEEEDKKSTKTARKKSEDTKKDDESLKTEESGTRKNLRRKPCHLYAENLSSNSEDDLELLIQNRSDEIETQNLMNHPRKSKKILDQILAKSKMEAKQRAKETKDESSSEEEEEEETKSKAKNEEARSKSNEKSKPTNKSAKQSRKSEESESESEKSSMKQPKTPRKELKVSKKITEMIHADEKSGSADDSSNQKRSLRASRTHSLMIDTSSDDSEDDPLLAIAKTISRNEVRMSRRSIDLLHAKEKEILKKNETSEEEDSDESGSEEEKTPNNSKTVKKSKDKDDGTVKEKAKEATDTKNELVKPIALSGKGSQCSSLDVSNKISSLIEKDKLKRLQTSNEKSKEQSSVTSEQLKQEALQRLSGELEKRPCTPEKKTMSREQLHSSWKSAFQNLKLPKTSPSVSKKPMDRNAWIRKHAVLSKPKLGEFGKHSNANFEPFKRNYSRSSSPMSLSSQNSDNVTSRPEGKHHNLPMPVEQTLKRMANVSPKVNKSFHFERNQTDGKPTAVAESKPLSSGKIEDIPKAGNTNDQIMKWLNDSLPNDDSSCDTTNSTPKKTSRYCDDTDTSVTSSVIDKGIVSAPIQLKDIFSSPSFASEKISSVKVDDYKRLQKSRKDVFTSPSMDRKRYEETPKKHLESETDSLVSDLSSCDERPEKKAIFQQRRTLAERLKERRTESSLAKIAFSPQNESSVYAFEPEPASGPPSTPFRRSKTNTTPSPVPKPSLSKPGSPVNSSIAVQVSIVLCLY